MSDELEPTDDVIQPTGVYGPDDWRPYSPNPIPPITPEQMAAVNAILVDLFNAAGQGERHKAYEYDPLAPAEYTDPMNVREADKPMSYTVFDPQREAERRLRQRMEFAAQLQDPKNIFKGIGTA